MILKFVIVSNRHFYAFLYISTLRLLGLFIFLRNGGYVNARKDLEKKTTQLYMQLYAPLYTQLYTQLYTHLYTQLYIQQGKR